MRPKTLSRLVILAAGLMLAGSVAGAQDAAQTAPPVRKLELKFNNGLVTLKAQNVTIRDILTEWAKQCDCDVVGADKITNSPLPFPVQYDQQPEAAVIKSLLSPGTTSGGYLFVPRDPGQHGASIYASLRIAPVSHASTVTYSQPTSSVAAPLVNDNDELPPVVPITLQAPGGAAPENRPATPSSPSLPPGVMPTTGVNSNGGRSGGPGTPTVPPTGGRGGGL